MTWQTLKSLWVYYLLLREQVPSSLLYLTFYYIKSTNSDVFFSNTIAFIYISRSSISWLSNFSHTSTSWLSETFAEMAVLNVSRLDCCKNNKTGIDYCNTLYLDGFKFTGNKS